jgi:hypothetical protein
LTACATGSSACPPVKDYPKAFVNQLGAELSVLPAGTAIEDAIKDYIQLRDQVRACRAPP